MKLTVSPIAGVAYLYLGPVGPYGSPFGIETTKELGQGVLVDYSPDGDPLGYEMLDAAKFLSPSLYERPWEASEAELGDLLRTLEALHA